MAATKTRSEHMKYYFHYYIHQKSFVVNVHQVSHKRGKVAVYDCSVCQKNFPDKVQLEAHEKIHIVDRTYHCPKCNKIFFKEFSLMTHQCTGVSTYAKRNLPMKKNSRETTPIAESKKIKCPKCPATFENSKLKNLHMRKHTEQKVRIILNIIEILINHLYKVVY